MPTCSPQRFLAGNRNLIREAILAASAVQTVTDNVLEVPVGRVGTAQVVLAGPYDGAEQATYDVEIVDDTASTPRTSAPVFSGTGSGTLTGVSTTLSPQTITISLADAGTPESFAAVDFEGVRIQARVAGASGNDIRIIIDQTALTFTPTVYSLLSDLKEGSGAETTGLEGPAFDWDTKVLGADNVIPDDAHRVAFGDDESAVYLQYKEFVDGNWLYHFVPEIKRDIPKGTAVLFVTNGRTVTITDGVTTETYPDVVTVYDLLNLIRTQSMLVQVIGVVANDRSPTGQAARELLVRTDAHAEPSTGTGSDAATGFDDVFVNGGANTELITARCFAVSLKDHPLAHVGAERWKVKGSVSGDLGDVVTGIPFVDPNNSPPLFGFTIPTRLPDTEGTQVGQFTLVDIIFVPRDPGALEVKLCVGNLHLGPAATDGQIELEYTKRPSGDCNCLNMPLDPVNAICLTGEAGEGDANLPYSTDAQPRIEALYDWAKVIAVACASYKQGYETDGVPETAEAAVAAAYSQGRSADGKDPSSITVAGTFSGGAAAAAIDVELMQTGFADLGMPPNIQATFDDFDNALQLIDAVTDAPLKAAGFAEWDDALAIGTADLDATTIGALGGRLATIAQGKYRLLLNRALAYAGVSPLGKSDASADSSGDGCWQDYGDPYYWEVKGPDGKYAPAFNNHIYYSSRRATDKDKYYSTHEFALQVMVKCPERLIAASGGQPGDRIILQISGAPKGSTYQVGDELELAIIAAQPLYLAGGRDGDNVQTWNVEGDVDGPFPNYTLDPDAPTAYSMTSPDALAFLITEGGIAFAMGDRFTFTIEGGHYRWRKNGGAYSGSLAIPTGAVALDSGLTIEFIAGAFPSFVALDLFSFVALQPWAVSNLQSPDAERWQWGQDSPDVATLVADFGSAQIVDMLSIALHTLPAGTMLLVEGGPDGLTWPVSQALTWREGVIAQLLPTAWSTRYLRLTITNAAGGGIGWFWAGEAFSTELSPQANPRRTYKVDRASAGLYQGGQSRAKAIGADVEWTEGALKESEVAELAALVDWVKGNDDEPLIFVPNVTRPENAIIARITADEIDFTDLHGWGQNAGVEQRGSARLTLDGVWR